MLETIDKKAKGLPQNTKEVVQAKGIFEIKEMAQAFLDEKIKNSK